MIFWIFLSTIHSAFKISKISGESFSIPGEKAETVKALKQRIQESHPEIQGYFRLLHRTQVLPSNIFIHPSHELSLVVRYQKSKSKILEEQNKLWEEQKRLREKHKEEKSLLSEKWKQEKAILKKQFDEEEAKIEDKKSKSKSNTRMMRDIANQKKAEAKELRRTITKLKKEYYKKEFEEQIKIDEEAKTLQSMAEKLEEEAIDLAHPDEEDFYSLMTQNYEKYGEERLKANESYENTRFEMDEAFNQSIEDIEDEIIQLREELDVIDELQNEEDFLDWDDSFEELAFKKI